MNNGIPLRLMKNKWHVLSTVNSPLTDTLVSRQLYLRTPFQIPVLPSSQTLYLHVHVSGHSSKQTALLTDAFSNPCFTFQSNFVFTHSCKRTL